MNLHFGPFSGIVPRRHFSQSTPGEARVARDVNLLHGTLRPWREPRKFDTLTPDARTFHVWGCCLYGWNACVEVAEWLPNCPRLYVTGDQPWPSVENINAHCDRQVQRLGLPMPAQGPVATPVAEPSWTVATEARVYVYTYENDLEEESGPSAPGNEFNVDDNVAVTVTGFEQPSPEWNVRWVNVYRRGSGMATGAESTEPQQTAFFLVAKIPAGQASLVDAIPNLGLGRALLVKHVMPPPAAMRGITAIEGTRTLAGFVGNKLYFSATGQPWNWPEGKTMTLEDNILALCSSTGVLYVMTDGHPYALTVNEADEMKFCNSVTRASFAMPLISCCSNRGVVSTPSGVVYVSTDGLVLAHGASWALITEPWFAFDDWRRVQPENMRLGFYESCVFAVSDQEAFVLRTKLSSQAHVEAAGLTTISDRPQAMFTARNGELYMLTGDTVRQWNAGDQWREFCYEAENVLTAGGAAFTAARVSGDGAAQFTLLADDRPVYQCVTPQAGAFRLPRYGRHHRHAVRVTGSSQVWGIDVATTRMELAYRSAA